ncbi:hypothetical protein BDF21DRAFT_395197 [Thamnidium elegans]|nr:hypothetical protein BDF21DRAFT_395197 [Thamnidium elegans]
MGFPQDGIRTTRFRPTLPCARPSTAPQHADPICCSQRGQTSSSQTIGTKEVSQLLLTYSTSQAKPNRRLHECKVPQLETSLLSQLWFFIEALSKHMTTTPYVHILRPEEENSVLLHLLKIIKVVLTFKLLYKKIHNIFLLSNNLGEFKNYVKYYNPSGYFILFFYSTCLSFLYLEYFFLKPVREYGGTERIPCKRILKDNDTKKKTISLSLRKTRLKKETEPNLSYAVKNEIDDEWKQENVNMPCLPSFNFESTEVRLKEEYTPEHLNCHTIKSLSQVKVEEQFSEQRENKYKQEHTDNLNEYACPICKIDLSFNTTEFRQTHMEECISSLNHAEQVIEGCIICGKELVQFSLHQKEVHLNRCLDNSTVYTYQKDFNTVDTDQNPNAFVVTDTESDTDFSTKYIISKINQRRVTKNEDKNDELYQTTLALSKSLNKVDKKVKIEMNEANIWSNQESRAQANNKLFETFQLEDERHLNQQTEREVSIGFLKPSKLFTDNTSASYWELASLPDCNPAMFTCLFLNKLEK